MNPLNNFRVVTLDSFDCQKVAAEFERPSPKARPKPRIFFLGMFQSLSTSDQRTIAGQLGFDDFIDKAPLALNTDDKEAKSFNSLWERIQGGHTRLIVVGGESLKPPYYHGLDESKLRRTLPYSISIKKPFQPKVKNKRGDLHTEPAEIERLKKQLSTLQANNSSRRFTLVLQPLTKNWALIGTAKDGSAQHIHWEPDADFLQLIDDLKRCRAQVGTDSDESSEKDKIAKQIIRRLKPLVSPMEKPIVLQRQPVAFEEDIPVMLESEFVKLHPDYPNLGVATRWENVLTQKGAQIQNSTDSTGETVQMSLAID